MKKMIFLFLGGLIILLFPACDNQSLLTDTVDSDELTIAETELSLLKTTESLEEEIDAARFAFNFNKMTKPPKSMFGRHFPECADVSVNGDEFPKTISIDYGDECISRRGIQKTGKVIITISDSLKTPGAEYTVVYENVTINGKAVDFESTYTFEGENEAGNIIISCEANSTIERNDSTLVVRTMNHSKEWLEGFDTPYIDDDMFLLSGGGTTIINDSMEFTRSITDPLFYDRACRFILSGIIEITRNDESMIIDFGDGTCDNIAVVTKDGESQEIELISSKFKERFDRAKRNMGKRKGWW